MKKRNLALVLLSVSLALLSVMAAIYVASGSREASIPGPDPVKVADRDAGLIASHFKLGESDRETIFRLYKEYYQIRAAHDKKRRAVKPGEQIGSKDLYDYLSALTAQKSKMKNTMKTILTDEVRYEEWLSKDPEIRADLKITVGPDSPDNKTVKSSGEK